MRASKGNIASKTTLRDIDIQDESSNSHPPTEEIDAPRYTLGHSKWWPVLAGALVGILIRLLFMGKSGQAFSPMLGSFIYGAPLASAAISTWLCGEERRARLSTCMYVGTVSACLVVLGALLIAVEGWICAILIFPVFALTGMLTGMLMWAIYQFAELKKARNTVYSLAAIPLMLGAIEPELINSAQEYHTTERTVFIAAAPDVVWQQIANTATIEDRHFSASYNQRVGAPVPLEARSILKPDGTWERQMRWTKGVHFFGDVRDWQPGVRMTWQYRFSDDAFPVGAMDSHVTLQSPYFELLDGKYTLTPMGQGTELTETTHWRISTKFNAYSRMLGEAMIGDTVDHILLVMKERSEQTGSGSL